MSIVKAFNEHFDEFVTDIRRVFPDNTDVAAAHTALMALKKTNPKLILITFRDRVAIPYKDHINAGNIEFFITKNYNDDLEIMTDSNSSMNIQSKIDTLREPISNMNQVEQEKVVTYLKNLVKLCDLYV